MLEMIIEQKVLYGYLAAAKTDVGLKFKASVRSLETYTEILKTVVSLYILLAVS